MASEITENRLETIEEKPQSSRKALFPNDDADSDLGHMSPIHSECSNFSDVAFAHLEADATHTRFGRFFKCSLSDYVVLNDDADTRTSEAFSESAVPPLYLSPAQSLLSSPMLYSPMHATANLISPLKKSPTSTLKTPHDTATVKLNQKQTKRKLLVVEEDEETQTGTDGTTASKSPESKQPKLDAKSKVRTALFPEFMLPVQNFYPKDSADVKEFKFKARDHIAALVASTKSYKLPKRLPAKRNPTTTRRRYGEINAGVRHKIHKPKQKKASKVKIAKATQNIIENIKSPLSEYLHEMTSVKKTIKPLPSENDETQKPPAENAIPVGEDKENQQAEVKNRKFFKNLRSSKKPQAVASPLQIVDSTVSTSKDEHTQSETNTSLTSAQVSTSSSSTSQKRKFEEYAFDSTGDLEKIELSPEVNKIIENLDNVADIIFSPTSQMCDMASALDINSPKRAKLNINAMLNTGTSIKNSGLTRSSEKLEKSAKLFPLFYSDGKPKVSTEESSPVKKSTAPKRKFHVPDNQLLIDAGQKRFGMTECFQCNFIYEAGDPGDESLHKSYHDAIHTFKFNGWKNERVVCNIDLETRIIKLIPSDPKSWWRKGHELAEFIERELGYFNGGASLDKSQMYLYVKNKKIIGCLIAEMKHTGYKMLPTDMDVHLCSEESFKIRCGVSRVWVASSHRRAGIARQMLDCLRRNFLHGYFLKLDEIAMGTPTDSGSAFAKKYFNTENYLIYIH